MSYQATITQKGQITIPKKIRDALHLEKSKKVIIELEDNMAIAKIMPVHDFLEVAGQIKVKKATNPLKARTRFDSEYVRS